MKKRIDIGYVSKRESELFEKGMLSQSENSIKKATMNLAAHFEKELFKFMLEKRVKKVLSVRHTEYKWSEGRIDTCFKFFTEDEKDAAIEYAKNFCEYVNDYDFTNLAEMTDDEFMRISYEYTGQNEDVVREWRNAVRG